MTGGFALIPYSHIRLLLN